MGKFIVFEGLDGSGKTVVSQLVAKEIGAVWKKTPPAELSSVRHYVDTSQDELLRFHYYMIGNIFLAEQATQLQAEGKTVICDRYVDSTLVYFQYFGLDVVPQTWVGSIKKPDLKIFLDISYEKRRERLASRGSNTVFDEQTNSKAVHEGLRDLYLQDSEWLVVETDNFCGKIDEQIQWIVELIKQSDMSL